ncbi:KTSC domain-containing protein [Vibrio aphrogenes]|uniref:KTSC domain-containing protein n=1 Tax=Vibrio aphrogenes TaxID=1891186 RepID=UPI000B34D46A|nr:KTSC domain-containing protein [Vibrio aphrogenes]
MKFIILFFLLSSLAHANCIDSVDNTNVYYVNGMFTNQKSYNKNMVELQKFVSNHLNVGEVNISSSGSWNPSEPFLEQFKQVALQKFTELNVNQTVQDNIAKTFSGFSVARTSQQSAQETTDVMSAILKEISDTYYQDQTFNHAYHSVTDLLDNCNRVVLIGHSQGNFYTNALLDALYADYRYPDGSTLNDYRMLGYFGFALPTSSVGGYTGTQYPHLMGFVTNDNDIVMAAVRYTIGALPSNYDNDFSLADFTGHSLIVSYLEKYGQANLAASSISHIVSQQYPPPISEQHSSNSSAMSSYGYSYLSQILDIKFKDSSVYRYNYVPSDVFESFEIAESQGAFLNTEIKGIYPYIKLSE